MLSGGRVGQFRKPRRGEGLRKCKPRVAPKVAVSVFPTFVIFWNSRLNPLPVFEGLTVIRPRDPKVQDMPELSLYTAYLNNLMVAYRTDDSCWLQ